MGASEKTEFELVESRLLSTTPHGVVESDDMMLIMETLEKSFREEPYFMWEVVVKDVDGVAPGARKIAADRLQTLPDRAIALVGGNFSQRILAKLVLKAVDMLGGNPRNASKFFGDRDSARAWLREYAKRRDAELGS